MNTIRIEAKQCPNCGRLMPAGALDGLCPACLLGQGADTDAGEPGGSSHFTPPTIEEVAKLFPQLEVLSLLGAGGMGAVYKARQPALDRFVALKILPASGVQGVNFEERFNREARALARLSHPNIVAVHEFGKAGGLHYFLMEFVDGANLRQLERAGRLSPREALQIVPQICDALQYAHDEGVVHRDIKPENVLMDRKGRVKIADFGLAKILGREGESSRLTLEGQIMGTPHYMAPEQVERPLTVDHRADIYSLGVVFYEMLTGDLPLGKFSPPSRKFQLDVRLDDVVLRALENDPARRYQNVSEVKSRVESITNTPPPVIPAARLPEKKFFFWAGFPVAVEHEGARKLNWKGTLRAFGILFGALTIGFGIVSLITGRSLLGWIGIAGSLSLKMRLMIAALVTTWGVWHTLRAKQAVATPPQTPQGTVILPPEKFSRKAVFGALWAPIFFIAAVIAYFTLSITLTGDITAQPALSRPWWQILLATILLLPGLTAPFGTTILGWMAVRDIRRARGRIGGLPLALFDGLLFPLLALDVLIYQGLIRAFYWFTSWFNETTHIAFVDPPGIIVTLVACVSCAQLDFHIIRRVWRAVRLDVDAQLEPWWSTRWGAITIAVGCVLIISGVGERHSPSRSLKIQSQKKQVQQAARRDPKTGRLVVDLPGRGKVELLAVGEPDAAPNGWWLPDGKPVTNATYEVRGALEMSAPGRTPKELLFRVADLPQGASRFGTEADPESGSGSDGDVLRDGKLLPGAGRIRFAWEPNQRTATVRMGFGLVPWRTIAMESVESLSQHSIQQRLPTDPNWSINFHRPPFGSKDNASVSVVFGPEDRLWAHRVVAVDTNGVEHSYNSGQGTPIDKQTLWTYTWNDLPLPAVKEFRLQVQPVHWIEFRNLALWPRTPVPPPQPPQFGAVQELTFDEIIDFDSSIAASFPPDRGGPKSFDNYANLVWMRQKGFDAGAGIGELRPVDMDFTVLKMSDWDDLSAPELVKRIYENHYRPGQLKALAEGRLPATYGFRTREHGIGILQLVAFADGKPGATVRFKLTQRETEQPGPSPGQRATKLQIAKRDAETGVMVAKLPGHSSLELLALANSDPTPVSWWRPDGTRLNNTAFQILGLADYPTSTNVRRKDFVFKITGNPPRVNAPIFDCDPAINPSFGGEVTENGRKIPGGWALRDTWAPDVRSATLRFGYGLGSWRTVLAYDPKNQTSTLLPGTGDPEWMASIRDVAVTNGALRVTAELGPESLAYLDGTERYLTLSPGGHAKNWRLRIVVLDGQGNEQVHDSAQSYPVPDSQPWRSMMWKFRFPGLTPAAVKEVRIQAESLYWVEFRNVSLQAR